MATRNLRAEARIAVRERGSLKCGDAWFPCTVLNMSNNGFFISCNKELSVGQLLEFRCELFPGKNLECKIEIRHVSHAGMGSKIVEIDNRGINLCQLYLEEQYSHKLTKS